MTNNEVFELICNVDYLRHTYLIDSEVVLDLKDITNREKSLDKLRKFVNTFFADVTFDGKETGSCYFPRLMKIEIAKCCCEDIIFCVRILSHEFAHHIQVIALHDVNKGKMKINSFKNVLRYERSTERLAYFICKKYFSNLKKYNHRSFRLYHRKSVIDSLKEFIGGEDEFKEATFGINKDWKKWKVA